MMKFQEKPQIDRVLCIVPKILTQDAFSFMDLTIIIIDTVSLRLDIFLIYFE